MDTDMSHRIIIIEDGAGEGGSATTEVTWAPSHGISPTEEARRRERAEKLAQKINRVLYGGYEEDGVD
jgi:hypothetical protein